jgi:glyoxylase-like metal-dependent hydrolase (beta-lactamase superfamily II)
MPMSFQSTRTVGRSRRQMLAAVLAGAALAAALPLARAEAPLQGTQVPGYYRAMVGGLEVTALHDGQIQLDAKLLKGASPQDVQRLLARMFRGNPTSTAVNAYLVNLGSRLVLVDAGAGRLFGPALGQVLANLKAAGHQPEQVDDVLITHLHGDHVGGLLTAEGLPAFPRATLHVARTEADFWLSAERTAQAPAGLQPFFKMAQDSVRPYADAGRLKTFAPGAQVLPGVTAVALPGHTPGHSGYRFSSGAHSLLVWGDVVHNAAVQMARPQVAIEFDVDSAQAVATRREALRQTAASRQLVAGMHLPFPGLGHVRAEGRGGYEWVPMDFAPLPAAVPAAAPASAVQ